MTETDIDAYIDRYTAHLKKQLAALSLAIQQQYAIRPFWDPLAQKYRFARPNGSIVPKPEEPIQRPAYRGKLFGKFGNANNKGKKWSEARHLAAKLQKPARRKK